MLVIAGAFVLGLVCGAVVSLLVLALLMASAFAATSDEPAMPRVLSEAEDVAKAAWR